MIVTTSWDDGHPCDSRLSELLHRHGIKGTFYVPLQHSHLARLDHAQLLAIAASGSEIGSHGMLHRNFAMLGDIELEYELARSKDALDQILGRRVTMLCYPWGQHNARVRSHAKAAGYSGARTTQMLASSLDFPPFQMPTTLQALPHHPAAYLKNIARRGGPGDLATYFRRVHGSTWVESGKRLFDSVLAAGGIWHLYGHSWELEQLGLWNGLAELLTYVAGRSQVQYLTNGEIIRRRDNRQRAGAPDRVPQAA